LRQDARNRSDHLLSVRLERTGHVLW
jgi:hypothetical protein